MYGLYATLYQARVEIDVQAQVTGTAAATINDNKVLQALAFVTERINTVVGGYEFLPRKDTVFFDALGEHIDDYEASFMLSNATGLHPLLSAATLIDGQGNTLVEGTDYYAYPRGQTPIFYLRMLLSSGQQWSQFATDWQDAISLTGVYGYRKRYSEAWIASGDTVHDALGINASVTTITVVDADGANANGYAPRFSAGNLIQIESEWLVVIATDPTANTLTVIRGVRGTTAAVHAKDVPISVFSVESDIVRACVRWASYLYARAGSFETTTYDGLGATVSFPPDVPAEVANSLRPYTDIRWVGV